MIGRRGIHTSGLLEVAWPIAAARPESIGVDLRILIGFVVE